MTDFKMLKELLKIKKTYTKDMKSWTPKIKPKSGRATCQDIVAMESSRQVSKHVIRHSVRTVCAGMA